MNTRMIVAAAVLAVYGGSMAQAEIDVTKLPPASTKQGLTFDKDIKPLFEASCVNCHGERRQRAGLRLDSLQATLQGSDEGKVVEVGNGKGSLLVHSVSQLDDETAMPPKRGGRGGGGFGGPPGGGGQGGQGGGNRERAGQGGPGGGPGGRGGGGGFNLAGMLAGGLFTQADVNKNEKLSKAEFSGLAGTWFDKIDTKKSGKLSQQEFSAGMDEVLPAIDLFGGGGQRGPGAGRGPGGQRGGNEGMGFGIGRMVGPAFFTAGDADKDGSLTRAELSETFGKWFTTWDTNKTDALTDQQFREGFASSMPRGGGRGPGGPGGGGFAGFGFGRTALAQQMITQGDSDKNEKLSKAELTAMADVWFDKVDAAKSGKVNQEQFSAKLAEALGMPAEATPTSAPEAVRGGNGGPGRGGGGRPDAGGPAGQGGGPRGGGVASMGPGLFAALDGDKDGSLTRAEIIATFEKWFTSFDTAKSGSLDNDSLYAGLREVIPQGGFGGMGGGGFPGGRGGGDQAKPLTAEQVGLVRAWIDQGAK